MQPVTDLSQKVCLVTGASRGLGRALSLEFARLGARLVINSRQSSADALAETERQIRDLGRPGLERHRRCIPARRCGAPGGRGAGPLRAGGCPGQQRLGARPHPHALPDRLSHRRLRAGDAHQPDRPLHADPGLAGSDAGAQLRLDHQPQLGCRRGRLPHLGRLWGLQGRAGPAHPYLGRRAGRHRRAHQQR